MFKEYKFIVVFSLIILLTSCGARKKSRTVSQRQAPKVEKSIIDHPEDTLTKKEVVVEHDIQKEAQPKKVIPKKMTYANAKENYISKYKAIAMQEMRDYHIPASITLAQGLLESGAGRSELSEKSNNHFGVKCHKGWLGEKVYHDDDAKGECFRKYKNPIYSFRDHSLFLSQRKRYAGLFKLPKNDYKAWAKGLRKAGYATDPRYPQKLINLIEEFKLYQYDNQVLASNNYQKLSNKVIETVSVHTVVKGDTLYSISKKYGIDIADLKQINKLENTTISIGQVLRLH